MLLSTNKISKMYKNKFADLCNKYHNLPEVFKYPISTWYPVQQYYADPWVNQCLHFGHKVSSCAVGRHANLKQNVESHR